ncbi:MAG: hypothetical protein ACTS6O_01180 [Giesbergeria sp.]
MQCAPVCPNLVHTRARLVATAHELKHQFLTLVAALAHAALQQLHRQYQQRASVGQLDVVRLAEERIVPSIPGIQKMQEHLAGYTGAQAILSNQSMVLLDGVISESTPPLVTLEHFREQLQTITHMGIGHDQ